ncbi:hypothetical protein F2Q70_00022142 [Brassica cretica]|uniref:Uncharacterized protein n=1 Tax=Brassica cretica TaxID=69181 RepID=A0A8S9HQQ5_BRACR|nr:hypothetical protein F2Q70_00022142 [Brassica cretica]KAF2559490.1 hypothetical protein F2Q68_00015973 [Brassica cretica]
MWKFVILGIGFDFGYRFLDCVNMHTRGGGQVGSHRSRHNQGLEVEDLTPEVGSATTLKMNKKRTAKKVVCPKKNVVVNKRRRGRKKKVSAQDNEVEDVTPLDDEVEDVTPQDEEVEDVTPQIDADQAEKAMSEDDKEDSEIEGEACLTGHE